MFPFAAAKCSAAFDFLRALSLPDTTQQRAIQKADVLIEALGWIRQFRDKVTVIKLGGSVMEDRDALRHLLLDIVFMETVGMRPVRGPRRRRGHQPGDGRGRPAAALHPRPPLHRRRHAATSSSACWPTKPTNGSPTQIEEFGGRADAAELPHDQRPVRRAACNSTTTDGAADRPGPRRPRHARRPHHDRQSVLRRHRAGHSLDVPSAPTARS